ncbi:MAG: tRNA (adenosine(37)-N6)-threonylcarbamoyltransferase complex transferase subunit TsaD [Opitutales bacterium]|nr:tRNA (adenosine(37)-N6)-threonylcarbamoyltransferase complex transferase subunit TsaD [Opitutales bacterium]
MILAIESSCDESALALFDPARGMAGEWVHSQIARHRAYGGVVPDIASREHLTNFPALLGHARECLGVNAPARIAVTIGPGLAGCLALGIALARALGQVFECPVVGVNHLRGHVFSPFISAHTENPGGFDAWLAGQLPHLGLVVSGGNTLLVRVAADRSLTVLARTVDDAAGEALDKGAKLLGLAYPGGPLIEARAGGGDPAAFAFPRPSRRAADDRFSFSGLKTSLRYQLEKLDDAALESAMADICASYQQAVVDALVIKTDQGLRAAVGGYRSLGLSGGVANNSALRAAFAALAGKHHLPLHVAQPRHTGDNAAMIAFAAHTDPAGLIHPDACGRLAFVPALGL